MKRKSIYEAEMGLLENIENLIIPIRSNFENLEDLYEILKDIPIPIKSKIIQPGDIVATDDGTWIGIISRPDNDSSRELITGYYTYVICKVEVLNIKIVQTSTLGLSGPWSFSRLATLSEVKTLISTLKREKLKWNPKTLQIYQEV